MKDVVYTIYNEVMVIYKIETNTYIENYAYVQMLLKSGVDNVMYFVL